ncbi:hypothetical protein HKX48_005473 [Thoreauomyces humboldtii]|nr:hypothetical protein HKX48_005473 [Thoreauomyces humboldtii]
MPRKDFQRDLQELKATASSSNIAHLVSGIASGDEDGEFVFEYHYTSDYGLKLSVQLQDLHLYPHGSTGYVFLLDSKTDDRATSVGDVVSVFDVGSKTICEVVVGLCRKLCTFFQLSVSPIVQALEGPDIESPVSPTYDAPIDVNEDNASDNADSTEDEGIFEAAVATSHLADYLRSLVLRDAAQIQQLPYANVGYLMSETEKGFILYITVPLRDLVTSELLSPDHCGAWNLDVNKYIVILMMFDSTYACVVNGSAGSYVSGMVGDPHQDRNQKPRVEFRLLTSEEPVVSVSEGFMGFRKSTANKSGGLKPRCGRQLTPFLLSWTLSDILNTRFLGVLSNRLHLGCDWAKAEKVFIEQQTPDQLTSSRKPAKLQRRSSLKAEMVETLRDSLENLVVTTAQSPAASSMAQPWNEYYNFPLLALRYVLRRLMLSSKFCLVCHRELSSEFEALKPYVCERSLCTYQYMELGLGPSIELEILHHPNVVDMLVSLAYTASTNNLLTPFPHGIGYETMSHTSGLGFISARRGNCLFFRETKEVQAGDLLEYSYKGNTFRCKVRSEICSSVPEERNFVMEIVGFAPAGPRDFRDAKVPFSFIRSTWVGWDKTIGPDSYQMVMKVLQKLPGIRQLRKALQLQIPGAINADSDDEMDVEPEVPGAECEDADEDLLARFEEEKLERERKQLEERRLMERQTSLTLRPILDPIDPLIYPLLRWIICSNRSFIKELSKPEEKITGLGTGLMQFKMIMSHPEKEEKFAKAQKTFASEAEVESLWAFHGSPLYNWHSILRTGLNTQKTTHGRAYGHGIYHALSSNTSVGYAVGGSSWPSSKLGIVQCMSLNEIVNSPSNFVSVNPYLVVANIDWVQTRFLLVGQTFGVYQDPYSAPTSVVTEVSNANYLPMDPIHHPVSGVGGQVKIPKVSLTAVLTRAIERSKFHDPGLDELREQESQAAARAATRSVAQIPVQRQRTSESIFIDLTCDEDLSKPDDPKRVAGQKWAKHKEEEDILGAMEPPSYATTVASRAIGKELMQLKRLQEARSDCNWTIDLSEINNLYQ